MPYYLRHHFDPFFDHTNLSPAAQPRGKVDHYCLSYVQNVVKGQIIAELFPLPEGHSDAEHPFDIHEQFILATPTLPVGPNTQVNPLNDRQLLATHNGYVFYHKGLISVKKLLNIHGPVDFHTGNVLFINDICVEGPVRSGFELQGRNILLQDTVEGAKIKAHNNLTAECGIKGAKICEIDAGETIKAAFCENCQLTAGADIVIEGSSLHSHLSVNGQLIVKERLQGGTVYANDVVYIGEQLGGGINTPTSIVMGYPPILLKKVEMIEEKITIAKARIKTLRDVSAKSDLHREEKPCPANI